MADNFNQIPNPNGNSAEVQNAVNAALNEQKKKKRKKKLIILAVVAVVIIGIIAAAGSGSSDDTPKVEPAQSSASAGDSTEAAKEEATEAAVPELIKAGSSVTLKDVKITYVSCDADFKNYSEYAEVKDGNKVIRAEFLFENNSSNDVMLESFECYADNDKCEEFYSVDDYSSPALETISAGRKFKSVVYYEVPKNAKSIELECDTDFWTSDKLTFEVK